LHGEATLVGRLPFGEGGTIVQKKAGRLLSKADVSRSAEKERRRSNASSPANIRVRPYAALLSRLRLMMVSAICTVFSAAPLRRLYDTPQEERPLSMVWSSRMRETWVG